MRHSASAARLPDVFRSVGDDFALAQGYPVECGMSSRHHRGALAVAAFLLISANAQDATGIVRQSISKDMRNQALARNYTYVEMKTERELDNRGTVKRTNTEKAEVVMLCGAPYRRVVEKKGQPLSDKGERREEARIDKLSVEGSKDCAKRQAAMEERRRKNREFLKDVPDAFIFRLAGIEKIDGKDAYAIEAEPRQDFHFRDSRGRFLSKVRAKIWIDKAELQWVKVDAETTDTVSLGLFLLRLHKGAHLHFEQTRVNEEIWLPRRIHVDATGRAAMLLTGGYAVDIAYDNYKKFSTDSRIVSTGELK